MIPRGAGVCQWKTEKTADLMGLKERILIGREERFWDFWGRSFEKEHEKEMQLPKSVVDNFRGIGYDYKGA